jgi:predicted RNA binding protein YcfA (HicA-like mRNA interferase family)
MPKLPNITGEKLLKILQKEGFILKRITGSHHILFHPTKKLHVSVPIHKGKTLGTGITISIIKDTGFSLDEFLKLL